MPDLPNPESRVEQYLANLTDGTTEIPKEPESRIEQYLDYLAKNGGAGVNYGTAPAAAAGMALVAKTIVDGKVTEWEFGDAGGLKIHICTSSEYGQVSREPVISSPDEKTLYLVPAENGSSPDLFVEWAYVNGNWEMFGSASIGSIPDSVNEWLTEHITNPDNPPLDRSLTSSSAAAPADLVGEELTSIKQDLSDIDDAVFDNDTIQPINKTQYGTILTNFTVSDSDSTSSSIRIKSNTGRSVCYFPPAEKAGKVLVKSTNASYPSNIIVAKLTQSMPSSPSGSFYVSIDNGYTYTTASSGNWSSEISVGAGYTVMVDYAKSYNFEIKGNILKQKSLLSENVINQIDSEADEIANGLLEGYTKNDYSYTTNLENGYITDAGEDNNNYRPTKYLRTKGKIPIIRKTSNIYLSKSQNAPVTLSDTMFYFFDKNDELIGSKKAVSFSQASVFPPSGSVSFRYMLSNGGETSSPDIDTTFIQYFNVWQPSIIGNLRDKNKVNWCAMGDSITQGWISGYSGSSVASGLAPNYGWVQLLAEMKNWNLDNIGVGGTGYVRGYTKSAPRLAYVTDFSDYDIVTLAFGVNDWKSNYTLGNTSDAPLTTAEIQAAASDENIGNICRNMKYVIEKIISDNPLCKIVVITPINCAEYGDVSTNWGIGYTLSNSGTLEDVFEAEKTICEYYGISYIDMTHSSVVNRLNMMTACLDGVHPTKETHQIMAHEIASRIGFE